MAAVAGVAEQGAGDDPPRYDQPCHSPGRQPASYQQWRQWGAPWHHQAGEKILFMPHREAKRLGIPIGNWWVFDHERVADMDGNLITGSRAAACLAGCDLAIRHAAETSTA